MLVNQLRLAASGLRLAVTSSGAGKLVRPMLQVLLILSGLVPLALALVGLGRFAHAKYRRWRPKESEGRVFFV